jgi:PAS domain S-box-containing protein
MENLQVFYDLFNSYGLSSGKFIIDFLVWVILIVLLTQYILSPIYFQIIVPAIQYFKRITQTHEKVEKILKEVQTNGGGSLKDAVLAISSKVNEITFHVNKHQHTQRAILSILGLVGENSLGLYETDEKGNCTYVTHRWSEITSLHDSEAFGHGWINAVHAEDREEVMLEFSNAIRQERNFFMSYRLAHSDRKVVSYCFPLVIEKKVAGFIGVIRYSDGKS